MTAQHPGGTPPGIQVQPAPLSYAWGDWRAQPAQPGQQGELLGGILRLDTLYGKVYGFFETPNLGGFLAAGRLQLLRLPGGDQVAAQVFTGGLLIAHDLPTPPNGQPGPPR